MCLSSPKPPKVEPLPPEPPPPPEKADPAVKEAAQSDRRRAALARGRSDTILTGSQGLTTPANTTKRTLLGA